MKAMRIQLLVATVCMAVLFSTVPALAQEAAKTQPDDEAAKFLKRISEEMRIKEEYQQQVAKNFFESAQKRFNERMYEAAEKDLERALQANPRHEEAQALLRKTRRVLGKTTAGEEDLLSRKQVLERVRLQYTLADMRKTIQDARELLQADNYDGAMSNLELAQNSAKVLTRYIDVSRERGEINTLMDQVHAEREKTRQALEQKQREQADALAKAEHRRESDLHSQRMERLFSDAKQLFEDTRYSLAADKCREILRIDPRNQEVIAFLERCEAADVAEDIESYRKAMRSETDATWRVVRRLAVPYASHEPVLPDDWEEKRRRKGTDVLYVRADSEEDESWRRPMENVLDSETTFDFIATPLDDVIAFLRNLKRINITTDNELMNRGGLDVTLKLEKVRFRDALSRILGQHNLDYHIDPAGLHISTKEKIKQLRSSSAEAFVRLHYIDDLTVNIPEFEPALTSTTAGTTALPDAPDLFGPAEDDGGQKVFTSDWLIEFIKSVVDPNSWEEVLGGMLPL